MEQPQPDHGGDRSTVNSYGTDDPEVQARIEQARIEAAQERRRDRAELERLAEHGMAPDDAEALIEFTHSIEAQRPGQEQTEPRSIGTETATKTEYHPQIYVALTEQQNGSRQGHWLDATQPADDLAADITAGLHDSLVPGNQPWVIETSRNFGGLDLHGFTDLALIAQLGRGVAEHGVAYAMWVQIVGTADLDLLDRFDDFYVGSYDSPEDWARAVADDLEWDAHLDQVVDPMLRSYLTIDYARFARDQRQAWDVLTGIDGRTHIFMR